MSQVFRCLAVWLCVIGCGEVKERTDAGGDFALQVSPSALVIPIASARTTMLTVDRAGATGNIALSAENVPAGFEVTFTPSTLSAETTTSEIRVEVAGGTAATSASITIAGTSNGQQRSTTLDVSSTTITVTGRISGRRAGVTVRIAGKQPTTSDNTGSFTFTEVTPPYDLYTSGTEQIPSNAASPAIFYYQGLTRPDPEVVAPEIISPTSTPTSSATVNGTKTGGDTINERLIIWSSGGADRGTGATYTVPASWPQAATNVGTLFGLHWTKRPDGAPDTFLGYGSTTDTLTAGSTRTLNLALTAPASAVVSGTITPPPGFPMPSVQLQQQFGSTNDTLWSSASAMVVAATIPLVAAGTSTFFARSTLGTGTDMATTSWAYPALAATTDVSFAMPPPPTLSAPVAAATGVTTTTTFAFTSAPMTVHVARITITGPMRATYVVYTTSSTFTIPDVPELPLPRNQPATWRIDGYGPHAHVDEIATAAGVRQALAFRFDPVPPHYSTRSPTRSFTTAP